MADEPKFTPGPWRIDSELKVVNELGALARDIYSSSPDVAEGDTGICLVAIGSGDWADERREANARLIAAAPELFAVAVKACAILDAFRCDGIQPFEDASGLVNDFEKEEIHEALTAAIAKALGK